MIKKVYTVEVHEYDYFTGNKFTYKKFNTLKDALEYKRSKTYFIDSDSYSKAYLFRAEWIWELDKPARTHKPVQVWLNEQHEKDFYFDYLPF